MGQILDVLKKPSDANQYVEELMQKLLGEVKEKVSMNETLFASIKVQLDDMRKEIVELRSMVAELECKKKKENYGSGLAWSYFPPRIPHQSRRSNSNLTKGKEPRVYGNSAGEKACTRSFTFNYPDDEWD